MELYVYPMSMGSRAVQLTARAVGAQYNRQIVDVMEAEHMKQEFLEINFQHCVPTLVDDDLTLWESRAICQYLANQYGEDELYPKEPKIRAKVDWLLNFDMGTLCDRFWQYVYPVMMQSEAADGGALDKVHEALGWLDVHLTDSGDYAVGDNITIADHVLVATVSSIAECGIDVSSYEHVSAWLERCQENMEGYEDENGSGATTFGEIFKSKLE